MTEPFGVSLAFGYDQNGNRVLVQDSFGGTTQSTYDAANQLVTELFTQQGMPTLRIDQTYTADGQLASQTRSSDAAGDNVVATSEYTYDFNGNETQILRKGPTGAVLAEYDYTFDPAGDLVSETDNGVTTNYQYDSTGQLVGYGTTTQSYDANGNRNGSGYVVGPDNQLLSDGTWNYTYDAEGNEATKTSIATGEKWTYGYDNRNELVYAVETAADGTVEVQAPLFRILHLRSVRQHADPDRRRRADHGLDLQRFRPGYLRDGSLTVRPRLRPPITDMTTLVI